MLQSAHRVATAYVLEESQAGALTSGVSVQVAGVIETNRPDAKNAQYQATLKQGDLLLNRLQKLSRAIDVE